MKPPNFVAGWQLNCEHLREHDVQPPRRSMSIREQRHPALGRFTLRDPGTSRLLLISAPAGTGRGWFACSWIGQRRGNVHAWSRPETNQAMALGFPSARLHADLQLCFADPSDDVPKTDGGHDPTPDFGFFVNPGRVLVGYYVWFDTNCDGLQDENEAGIAGVVLVSVGPEGEPVTERQGAYFI
ncbi:hypothetical protein E9229_000627 [Paeniglutamicibacter cryotolerans]|uniref:SD-repeat containing protein B domain-containing protein n=1 Tax=Paeniglutamicibacter cryotolerans TaxID=670079 RepID=A0A839QK78_9MICC|nr:hypothetical protein [Paeniglutamicibacter cryotolerans]